MLDRNRKSDVVPNDAYGKGVNDVIHGLLPFQDSFYGILSVKRAPAMDTAWGRRVYDQYEIDSSVEKQMKSTFEIHEEEKGDKRGPQDLGLWDLLFNRDVVAKLDLLQR